MYPLVKDPALKKKKRVGRGPSSGHGKTCGRGQKGQKSRSGGVKKIYFEGGQTPLYRRTPKKKGFKNVNRIEYVPINLDAISVKFSEGERVDLQALVAKGLIKLKKSEEVHVKVLGRGELTKKLVFSSELAFSKTAAEKIKASGSTIEEGVGS